MSGCSIHQFRTIDQPLNREEMQEIDSWSSRFSPTSTGVTYIYHYGSFKKNVDKIFPQYFDAMLHFDNWGTTQLLFRFPKEVVDWKVISKFANIKDEICLDFRKIEDYVIMNLNFWEEEGGWIEEDQYSLDALLPLREEILNGDYRSLYLGWLMVQQHIGVIEDEEKEEEWEEEEAALLRPPVPANLQNLTMAQQYLIETFEIEEELVAAAATVSPNPSQQQPDYKALIKFMAEEEKEDFLLRFATGAKRTEIRLRQRLDELGGRTKDLAFGQSLSWNELTKRAIAIEQKNAKTDAEEKRVEHINRMEGLITQKKALWREVAQNMESSGTSHYDKVTIILCDLKEVGEYEEKEREFEQKLGEFISPYLRRDAFIRRLRMAGVLTIND